MITDRKFFNLKPYKATPFEKTIEDVALKPDTPMLPLIHKADAVERPGRDDPTAMDYFDSLFILPLPCDVFGEDLIYTYVGRPAFCELPHPVCFILRPESELLQNLFVFDTGAYHLNRYKKIVDNVIDINHFRIPAKEYSIRRFITLHFGDNKSYFLGKTSKSHNVSIMNSLEEFDYLMLVNLIQFNGLHFDTRCRTLENILRTPISLKKHLMAVILPQSQSENKTFTTFCARTNTGFEIMYYDDEQGSAAAATCNSRLEMVLFQYYIEKGYVTGESR